MDIERFLSKGVLYNMNFKRIFSIVIDFYITMFIGLSIFFIVTKTFNIQSNLLCDVLMIILFSLKDLPFKEGSIGKIVCKLKLSTIDNKEVSNIFKILRNLTVIIWPIELLLLIIFNKRIGDMLYKTKVLN